MKNELEAAGCDVIIPEFPHPDAPKLEEWLAFFAQYKDRIRQDSMFIGHSLGGAFALRALDRFKLPIAHCFLVASVWEVMGIQFDSKMSTFEDDPYDWNLLQSLCRKFTVFHGEGDPYIALQKSESLAQNLHAPLVIIPQGGHLNETAGFRKFIQLRDAILAEIKD